MNGKNIIVIGENFATSESRKYIDKYFDNLNLPNESIKFLMFTIPTWEHPDTEKYKRVYATGLYATGRYATKLDYHPSLIFRGYQDPRITFNEKYPIIRIN